MKRAEGAFADATKDPLAKAQVKRTISHPSSPLEQVEVGVQFHKGSEHTKIATEEAAQQHKEVVKALRAAITNKTYNTVTKVSIKKAALGTLLGPAGLNAVRECS